MLDRRNQQVNLEQWILSLPCHVKIPSQWGDDFEKQGATPASFDDSRRFPRFLCRGKGRRVALEYRQTLPALPRENAWHGVYTTNVSRGGCGFLHSEPLYPGEQMQLVYPNGSRQLVEVAWCRRVDERCFEVGARYVESSGSATEGSIANESILPDSTASGRESGS